MDRTHSMRRAALLIFLVLLMAGCAISQPQESPTYTDVDESPTLLYPTPTPTPRTAIHTSTPAFGIEPTEVPPTFYYTPPPATPTSTPAGTPTPTHEPGPEDYQITSFQMVDNQVGWATFAAKGTGYYGAAWLGRTTDGGQTWINVTPPEFEIIRQRYGPDLRPDYLKLSPLDGQIAWAYIACSSSSLCDRSSVIWHTEDGGLSWQIMPVPTDCLAARVGCMASSLQFVDLEHGWALMLLYGRNYIDYDLYRTVDGGVSWDGMPKSYLFAGPANSIYSQMFLDANFGVRYPSWPVYLPMADVNAGDFTSIRISRDSGYSWREITLPDPPGLEQALTSLKVIDDGVIYLNMEFHTLPDDHDLIEIATRFSQERQGQPFFESYYFSTDQARSWHVLSMPGDSFFLDSDSGWRVLESADSKLEQTIDGGATWKPFQPEAWELDTDEGRSVLLHFSDGVSEPAEIKPRFLVERLWSGQGIRLETLHMNSAMAGWGQEAGGETLCTQDGALTWQHCPPPVPEAFPTDTDLPGTEGRWLPDVPLPAELFHGGPIPSQFRTVMDRSRQFVSDVDPSLSYSPFRYQCASENINRLAGDRFGVSRKCTIRYPVSLHPDFGFSEGYWISRYYVTFDAGASRIWPNVVSMAFIDDKNGWRLLDMGTGLYRIDMTANGGGSWDTVKTVAWTGQLEFVSAEEGWAIARQPPERGVPSYLYVEDGFRPSALLHTVDSGRTWEELQPVIGP